MYKVVCLVISLLLSISTISSSANTNIEVSVITVNQEPHTQVIELSGTVVAKHDAQLAPLESGVVKDIYVESGDRVSAGQPLLALDDVLAKLRLKQAKANLLSSQVKYKEAKRQLDEVLSLGKSKAVADSLIAERRANLASAEADKADAASQFELSKEILKRHELTSPFEGVVSSRNVDVGEWINQQSRIFQLVSHKSLRLVMYLPQEYFIALSANPDTQVTVIPDVQKDKQYQLKISNFVANSDPTSRTVEVRVDLPGDTSLIPGMSALARFSLSSASNNLTWIPRTALKRHPDGGYSAYSVVAGVIQRHNVQIVKNDMDRVAVTGIPDASKIVVSGAELLKQNQSVIVTSKGSN